MKSLHKWPMLLAFALTFSVNVYPVVLGWAQESKELVGNEPAFRRVSNSVLCQCGCNYMVLSCNMLDCPSATYIRKSIRTSLAAGQDEQIILASFVEQYGPKILAEPPREGFFWVGWIMPFVALALGGGMVSYVLWKWSTGRAAPAAAQPVAAPQAASSAVVEKYRAQIDQELGKD